jgi:hypothetical protein
MISFTFLGMVTPFPVFEPGEMSVKSSICLGDELLAKSLFAYTRLIARQQQNGAALRIKGEGYALRHQRPPISSAFLFAWRESSKRVNPGPSQQRPELL